MLESEEALEGGNLNSGVVRFGETVRRRSGPWTPAVHHLLGFLADRGYPAPRPIGMDEKGREVLTFIPGQSVHPDHLEIIDSVETLRRVGSLITDFHVAQDGYVAPTDAIWRNEGRDPTGSDEVIAHNDLAPWNLITGIDGWVFIDWDLAAPGRRFWDLAWALHSFVGLWPESELTDEEFARRIAAFCDGAGVVASDRSPLLEVVVERTHHHADILQERAGEGLVEYQRLVADGHAEKWEGASNHVAKKLERWSQILET